MVDKKRIKETKHEISAIDGCLPPELITEILLRLPAKTLGRFKSVCQSWNGLISTHSFAKSHLQLSNPASLLFVREEASAFSFNSYLKGVCDLDGSSVEIEGDLTPLPSGSSYIMGLSHGLVCIKGSYNLIYVFNPTTRECRNIPFPGLIRPYVVGFGFGFGFLPSIDDYRLVLLVGCNSSSKAVYVFSLRDGQWRELDSSSSALDASIDRLPSLAFGGPTHAALWNEAFYRVVPVPQGLSLLKFDLIKEKFSKVSNLKRRASICVTEHNNLCVCQLASPSSVEIWMLDAEYGDWKLKLRFEPQFPVDSLLGSTSNGYVFMTLWARKDVRLVLVDTNQERPTYHLITKKGFMYAASFTASLISPHYGRQSIVF